MSDPTSATFAPIATATSTVSWPINDAAYPAVPITPAAELAELIGMSSIVIVVDDGAAAGFVLGMPPGLAYQSENYLFFSAPRARAGYHLRLRGSHRAGRPPPRPRPRPAAVCGRLRRGARVGADEVLCEVNLEPPNPGSLAFHTRLGFVEVGRQSTKGGANVVALLAAPVAAAE